MTADKIRNKAGLSYPHDPEKTDAMLRQALCDAADEVERLTAQLIPNPTMETDAECLADTNAHLTDIISDVNKIRKALNDDERPPKVKYDHVKSKLSDVSNALDDLYNEIVGI